MNPAATRLRELLASERTLVAPGAHDALGARLVERAGFRACYMTGNGAVASMLGVPDIGLASFTEMLDHARRMASAVTIPLISDGDAGYGGPASVARTVREFARAGIAGIHIEDQATPKRCGAMAGVALVPLNEARERIRVALDARDRDILVIARTDANATEGLDAAIERANAFGAEGADLVYIEMLRSRAELERVAREVEYPLFYDILELDPAFVPTIGELRELGFRLVINCLSGTRLYAAAFTRMLESFRKDGDLRPWLDQEMDLHAYEEVLGLSAYLEPSPGADEARSGGVREHSTQTRNGRN